MNLRKNYQDEVIVREGESVELVCSADKEVRNDMMIFAELYLMHSLNLRFRWVSARGRRPKGSSGPSSRARSTPGSPGPAPRTTETAEWR